MPEVGVPELLIIALIVLLLFGPAKAADLGGSLGRSIREFRKASREDDDPPPHPPAAQALTTPARGDASGHASSAAVMPPAPVTAAGRFCTECGTAGSEAQRFCTNCGAPSRAAAESPT